jgi:hypothetical protein
MENIQGGNPATNANDNSELHRRRFAFWASILVTALTFVSLSASYSTYLDSFKDWEWFGHVLALATTAGVELAFALLVYGIVYALIDGELTFAIVRALALLAVMACNFVTHSQTVRGIPLTGWQNSYMRWIGPAIPYVAILLLLSITFVLHKSKERRQVRRMALITRQRALDHTEAYLRSPELALELEAMNQLIAERVKRRLGVGTPPAPSTALATAERRVGFRAEAEGLAAGGTAPSVTASTGSEPGSPSPKV